MRFRGAVRNSHMPALIGFRGPFLRLGLPPESLNRIVKKSNEFSNKDSLTCEYIARNILLIMFLI